MIRHLCLVAALWAPVLAHADEKVPPVSRVLLYPDAAIVTRAVDVTCAAPATSAAFHGLPVALDPATLRASATGADARVEGLSIVEGVRRETASEALKAVERELEQLGARQEARQRQVSRAEAAKARAEGVRGSSAAFMNREAATQAKPNLDAWGVSLDLTRAAVDQASRDIRTARAEAREAQRRIDELERRRDALCAASPARTWDAEVVVRCTGKAKVELSYQTTAASWAPAYEARSDEAGGSLQLSVLADVKQGTGEDWTGVDVTLSTALSRRDAKPPKPQRLYVSAYKEEEKKKVLVTRQESAVHLEASGGPAQAGGELVATEEGLSVQLKVAAKADVAGDGRSARLLVETLRLDAAYSFVTLPKALPATFHRAVAVNTARYPLLPGPLDLFNANGFLGSTRLARTAQGDKMRLAFGLAEAVKVRRVVLAEETKEPGFFGSTRKLDYAYRFELANWEKGPVTLEVQDHVPVSELDDVKVAIEKQTTAGYELLKDDGLLTWRVPLAPGEKKNVELHFSVEIPSKYDSAGL